MEQPQYDAVHRHIEEIMPLLVHDPAGVLPYPFLTPGYGAEYTDRIYCWDNHHMCMRFALAGKPEYLKWNLDNFLYHQSRNGHVPNIVSLRDGLMREIPCFHAMPFLAQGALMYVSQTQDMEWLEEVFGKLIRYIEYFETSMCAPHGLFKWTMAYMCGFDNDAATTFFLPDTVIPVDINAWIYMEYLAASKLARLLENPKKQKEYSDKALALRKAVNDVLWMEEESSYAIYNLCECRNMLHYEHKHAAEGGRFAFQSCSNLIPLYARMASREQAERMLRKYVMSEDHFLSPYGIRSLSRSSDYYNNAVLANPPRYGGHFWMTCSNWQGPVWSPICYFMFNALLHYGLRDEAKEVADRIVRAMASVLEKQGALSENIHAETGRPGYCYKMGSWNILIDTLHDQLREGRWIMDPVFEDDANGSRSEEEMYGHSMKIRG